jgi:hypothetical protein
MKGKKGARLFATLLAFSDLQEASAIRRSAN